MEYLFLGLIVWAFLSLPALIYAGVVDGRRRRDAENFNRKLAELTRGKVFEVDGGHDACVTRPDRFVPALLNAVGAVAARS